MKKIATGLRFLSIALSYTFVFNVQSSEVDAFSNRFDPLNDSSEVIHSKFEELFDQSISKANKKKGCNEKALYKAMRKNFRNHVQGYFNRWLLKSKDVMKRPTVFEQSIYADFKWHEAFTIAIKNIYKDTAAETIRMGEYQFGSDKFEHFFGRGYAYFRLMYLKGKSLKEVLKFGHNSERYFLGAQTTGVYSYGDLAANFTGMRFWNHILQKHDDVLGKEHNYGPYVICENGKWKKNKIDLKTGEEKKYIVDWFKYIGAHWDEGNNCSTFRTKALRDKVVLRLENLSDNDQGITYQCPMEPEKIKGQETLYGEIISPWIINSSGHNYFKK